ncbi:transporter [uncultured Algibacter sp.]|uniref:transporter n=1 Tax=uncultured Algibacter sp. TaxID=298659 RepID=UPI002622478B|nr:transporter [uncultured Algibacter sp.]
MNKTNAPLQNLYLLIICLISFLTTQNGFSQDLEPRRWNILPLGTQVLGAGFAYTGGDILLDPAINLEDATVSASTVILQYVRPFKLGNKFARVDVRVPVSFAHWEGILDGEFASTDRNGFTDSRIRLSVNLIGPEASGPKELFKYFKENPTNTTVGASIAVTIPTGLYHPDKLLNIGQNRFVIRPQIGVLHNRDKWSYELTSSVIFFTNNDDFFGGNTRSQKPMFAIQGHIIKRFDSKLWASISAGTGTGSKSTINHVSKDDRRNDVLVSLSAGYTISKRQSLKLAYIYSRTTRLIGSNTDSIALGWALLL